MVRASKAPPRLGIRTVVRIAIEEQRVWIHCRRSREENVARDSRALELKTNGTYRNGWCNG